MKLSFNLKKAEGYKSPSQIARRLTESWFEDNMFCPRCGSVNVNHLPNNAPVGDFYCPVCKNQFELKSKSGKFSTKINDGAYDTMIERITSNTNPDFFFMSYSSESFSVENLFFVPKHFFVPKIIEKRKPLGAEAKRAGWTGCNILIDRIPSQGVVPVIKEGKVLSIENVVNSVKKGSVLEVSSISNRGWLFDVLSCINKIPSKDFTLQDIYQFKNVLASEHPENHNIEAKIRQQLQFLRDKGFIQFLDRGCYRII